MAHPKYADLPGIAYDQPDVYETADLPEADQGNDFYEEDENESIERMQISATDAFNKFRGKYLDTKGVDFSEKLSRRSRTGYDARSGDWELSAENEPETPIRKYQRLKCEIHDLLEDIKKIKDESTEDKKIDTVTIVDQVEEANKLLQTLNLEETLGKELMTSLSDPQGTQLQQLYSLLDEFKQLAKDTDVPKEQPKEPAKPDVITYKLEYRPEQAKLAQACRIGELEHRLHRLEVVLGTQSDKLSRMSQATNESTILEAVQYLTAKSSALDSSQLDHIEGRLIALTQKMDTISKQRTGTSQDAQLEQMSNDLLNAIKKAKGKPNSADEADIHQMASDLYEFVKQMNAASAPANIEKTQKVNEMYDFVKKIEPMADLLPKTVQRLVALNSFHQQATEFSNSLAQLESLQPQISSAVQNNKELLQGVQESFAMNMDVFNKNLTALNDRIKAIQK